MGQGISMVSIKFSGKVALILSVLWLQAFGQNSSLDQSEPQSNNSSTILSMVQTQSNDSTSSFFHGYSMDFYWADEPLHVHSFDEFAGHVMDTDWIRIGAPLTLSFQSQFGSASRDMERAYRMFFTWLNHHKGGANVGGRMYPVKLTLIDTEDSQEKAASITRFLVQERGIRHLLGPLSNGQVNQTAQVAHELGAVMVSPYGNDPSLFRDRPRVFGTTSPSTRSLTSAIAALAAKGARTIGYVQEDHGNSIKTCATVQPLAAEHGIEVVFNGTVPFQASTAQIAPVIARIKESQPDVMIGCVTRRACANLLRAAYSEDFDAKATVLTSCVHRPSFFESTDGEVVNFGSFVFGVTTWHETAKFDYQGTGMDASYLTRTWAATYPGEALPSNAVSAFVAAATLIRGIELAGTVEPGSVADALRNMDEMSLAGRMKFDDNGQNVADYVTLQITASGVTNVVAPSSAANVPMIYPKPSWEGGPCFDSNPLRIGRYGLIPADLSCVTCAENDIAPFNETLGYRVCKKLVCAPGRYSVIFHSSPSLMTEGAFCERCQRGHFAAQDGASQCESCEAGTYQDQRGETDCWPCPPGKYAGSRGTTMCIACPAGTYTDAYSSSRCKKCPKGAICDADQNGLFSNFTNALGYFIWIPSGTNYSEGQIYPCVHGRDGRSCVPGGCAKDEEGRLKSDGPFCGRCRSGFGRTSVGGDCEECAELDVTIMVSLASLLFFAFLAAAIFVLVLLTDLTRPRNMKAIIAKQVLNYLSMLQIVSNDVELRIPWDVGSMRDNIFDWLKVVGGSGAPVFATQSGECLAQKLLGSDRIFRAYVILGVIAVPIWSAICLLGFWIHRNYCLVNHKKPPRRSRLITLLVINLFVIHPPVTELCLLAFKCHPFDEPRLLLDTTVVCFSDDHLIWQILGFLGFVLFSLGIPLGTFLLLRAYKNAGKLSNRKTINTLGFLYSGFEDQFYYFESVFMLRKVLYQMLGVATFPGITSAHEEENRMFSNMAMLFLATMFLALHIKAQPYDNRSYFTLDRIESGSLWAILVTLLVQTFREISDESYLFSRSKSSGMATKARDIRDYTCTGVVIFFHLHFWLLTIFLMFRRRFEDQRIEEKGQKRCTDYGDVLVESYGLQVQNLSSKARKSFTCMFEEMSLMFVEYEGGVSCLELFATLQYMCVDAMYHRLKDKHIHTGAGLDHEVDLHEQIHKMNWKEKMKFRIAVVTHHFASWQMKKATSIRKKVSKISGSKNKSREHPAEAHARKKQEILDELQDLKRFNARTFEHCISQIFSVEELHLSMMRMEKELAKARATPMKNEEPPVRSKSFQLPSKSKSFLRQKTKEDDVGVSTSISEYGEVMSTTPSKAAPKSQPIFPESPEVDIEPEQLDKPHVLGMVRQLETNLRTAKAEKVRLFDEHHQAMLDKGNRIQAAHHECAELEDQIRRGFFLDSEREEPEEDLSQTASTTQRACFECQVQLTYSEGFCWNCGQIVKCDWKTIDSQEKRSHRVNELTLNDEKRKGLVVLQQQVDQFMQKVSDQKLQLECHDADIQNCRDAFQQNIAKIEAVRKDVEAVSAERINLAEKLEEAQERLFAARMQLNGITGSRAAQQPQEHASCAVPDVNEEGTSPSSTGKQNLIFRWLNAEPSSDVDRKRVIL